MSGLSLSEITMGEAKPIFESMTGEALAMPSCLDAVDEVVSIKIIEYEIMIKEIIRAQFLSRGWVAI